MEIKAERLEKLGLKKVSSKVKELQKLRRKMTIAYEHFRYVKPEKIDAFNEKLKKQTLGETGKKGIDLYHNYDKLVFVDIGEYSEVPPVDVLDKIEEAQQLGCFDTFEIAKIESVKEYKDPIVFGRIKDCPDRFFIAQWDDDVKIEQILNENEG